MKAIFNLLIFRNFKLTNCDQYMLNVLNYQREGWIYKKEIILKEICKIECNNAIHLQFMWKLIIMVDFEAHSYSSNNEHTC